MIGCRKFSKNRRNVSLVNGKVLSINLNGVVIPADGGITINGNVNKM